MFRHKITAEEVSTIIDKTLASSSGNGQIKKLKMYVNTYTQQVDYAVTTHDQTFSGYKTLHEAVEMYNSL